MKPLEFIVLSLAVYRVSILICRDAGPFHIFSKGRQRFAVLKCVFCVSIWVSVAFNLAYHFTIFRLPVLSLIALIFAMSVIAIALDRVFTADHLVD